MNKPVLEWESEAYALVDAGIATILKTYFGDVPYKTLKLELLELVYSNSKLWVETAARHARNEVYYRGLLEQCAEYLGPEASTSDDGVLHDSPICLKVPELVKRLTLK